MPRASRIVLSEVPLRVIQRGHDRQRCFLIDDDFEAYRRWLHEQALLVRCEVHAYVLMSNHVHLLVTVRAGMVRFPGNYKWSSYRSNAEGRHDGIITPHPMYERLGRNPSERRQAYLRLFHEALTPMQIDQIRTACNRGVLGDGEFVEKVKPTPQP
jgi:hypothetical protein